MIAACDAVALEKPRGEFPEKEKRPEHDTYDITWTRERRKFAFWTLDNVSVNHKDHVVVVVDERNRTVNWNFAAVVFMLSGLLNRGAPLQTLTLTSRL